MTEEEGSGSWPAFVLVVNDADERGWVPRRYLRRRGKRAVAIRTYDTTTLNPRRNEVLTVLEADTESGWLWCRDGRGNVGWFAIDHLRPEP